MRSSAALLIGAACRQDVHVLGTHGGNVGPNGEGLGKDVAEVVGCPAKSYSAAARAWMAASILASHKRMRATVGCSNCEPSASAPETTWACNAGLMCS